MRERIAFKEINYQIVFLCRKHCFCCVYVFVAYSVRVQIFSWDWGKVIRSASEYTLTDKLTDTTYFARYPNNQFWYCILTFFFRMVHFIWPETGLNEFDLASIALGCVMKVASILLLHHIAVLIWNEEGVFCWFNDMVLYAVVVMGYVCLYGYSRNAFCW